MRRVIIHNYLPTYDYEKKSYYAPYKTDQFMFLAEVDRGHGQGFQREFTMAKNPEEAAARLQSQFGSWAKVRNVKQAPNNDSFYGRAKSA